MILWASEHSASQSAPETPAHSIAPGRSPVVVAVAGTGLLVLVRLWLAHTATFCGTPDSCAYLALGESLSRHRGFVQNFLYQYQMVSVRLPQHGIEYWRPGTSFVFLLAQPFGGVTLHSSLFITIITGVLLAAAAWRFAWNASRNTGIACMAYLLCLALPPVWDSAVTPDSSIFYGAAVAWFLVLFRPEFRSYLEDALAWICLVVVNLIRNDAILLAAPVLLVLCLRRKRSATRGSSLAYCAVVLAAFLIAMVPMTGISHSVLGTAAPSHTTDSLYLTNLSELLYYGQPISLHTALAHGVKQLIALRLSTTVMIIYRFLFLMCSFGTILLAGTAFLSRELKSALFSQLLGPAVFWLAVAAAYGLALPAIGQFSALRSWMGVVPAASAAMAFGIAGYCKSENAARALALCVILFFAVSGAMSTRRSIDAKNEDGARDRSVADFLRSHGADPEHGALIMSADPAQFSETTGFPAIPVPSNGDQATLQAVLDLHPDYIVLQSNPASHSLEEIARLLHPTAVEPVPGTGSVVLTLAQPGSTR